MRYGSRYEVRSTQSLNVPYRIAILACNTAGMKISMAKIKVLHPSRNPHQRVVRSEWSDTEAGREVQVSGGCIYSTSDGRQDVELDTQIVKASAVMRAFHYSVVVKRELSKKAKLSIFKAVFFPILTYGYESHLWS